MDFCSTCLPLRITKIQNEVKEKPRETHIYCNKRLSNVRHVVVGTRSIFNDDYTAHNANAFELLGFVFMLLQVHLWMKVAHETIY
ncbi:CLUMA_CG021615, isoform A [Clunio marinus]|uniref:CLUMA_CG021615, isoform A n=1 Tax=Clunio marinus TaxID=568069 RepID=A0A1J1J7I6_9DIPT|nr:CLUMA_CG021615, isoform A [Clunio marinus]